jgi:hypothetical protein
MGRVRMWEVRAADGRVEDLLSWVADAVAGRSAQVYRSVDQDAERVVVMLGPGAEAAADHGRGRAVDPPDLPDPPADLAARRPGRWMFDRVE